MSVGEIKINYPPDFKRRYGGLTAPLSPMKAILDDRLQAQLQFVDGMKAFAADFARIPVTADEASPEPRWDQGWFPPLDGMSLYTMVATQHATNYIEIGSGNSTKFAARACRDHNLATRIVSIDPAPRAEIDELSNTVVRKPLEYADLSVFDDLESGDIVFFDGSHRCFENSDVTVFFLEVLPKLPAGVIVGVHDIFWPNDYPESWSDRYYSEQYVLAAYVLAFGTSFPLVFACNYMQHAQADALKAAVPAELLERLKAKGQSLTGGAFWFSKPRTPL